MDGLLLTNDGLHRAIGLAFPAGLAHVGINRVTEERLTDTGHTLLGVHVSMVFILEVLDRTENGIGRCRAQACRARLLE